MTTEEPLDECENPYQGFKSPAAWGWATAVFTWLTLLLETAGCFFLMVGCGVTALVYLIKRRRWRAWKRKHAIKEE